MRVVNLTLVAALVAAPMAAQRPEVRIERKPDEVRVERAPGAVRIWVDGQEVTGRLQPLIQRRARLGINVRLTSADTDSIGAFVESVTPGGPASKAGLRSGDIIIRLKGQSVLSAPGREVSRDESQPGLRLIELAAKLEPNDTIQVEFQRGSQRRTANLTTGDEPIFVFNDDMIRRFPGMTLERMPEIELFRAPEGGRAMAFMRSPLGDLELAPLNDDLGSYFGTTEGVLVIRAPSGAELNLRAGDVILSVDGRKATSPASLLRILRSYEASESFQLEIMRQKRRETVTGKLGR